MAKNKSSPNKHIGKAGYIFNNFFFTNAKYLERNFWVESVKQSLLEKQDLKPGKIEQSIGAEN